MPPEVTQLSHNTVALASRYLPQVHTFTLLLSTVQPPTASHMSTGSRPGCFTSHATSCQSARKVAQDGPSTWEARMQFQAPGVSLAQPWLLWPVGRGREQYVLFLLHVPLHLSREHGNLEGWGPPVPVGTSSGGSTSLSVTALAAHPVPEPRGAQVSPPPHAQLCFPPRTAPWVLTHLWLASCGVTGMPTALPSPQGEQAGRPPHLTLPHPPPWAPHLSPPPPPSRPHSPFQRTPSHPRHAVQLCFADFSGCGSLWEPHPPHGTWLLGDLPPQTNNISVSPASGVPIRAGGWDCGHMVTPLLRGRSNQAGAAARMLWKLLKASI